jgi:hypothetical protein
MEVLGNTLMKIYPMLSYKHQCKFQSLLIHVRATLLKYINTDTGISHSAFTQEKNIMNAKLHGFTETSLYM